MKKIDSFQNEPFLNFAHEKNKKEMEASLKKIKEQLGKDYPIIIGKEEIYTERKIISLNPGNIDEIVGTVSVADIEIAEKAHQVAVQTFKSWSKVQAKERAQYLLDAARLMKERRNDFSAWMIYESGKNWREADADTAEAIDFMEYYARKMLDLDNPPPLIQMNNQVDNPLHLPLPQENNKLSYLPLGVGICLPPWNFPLAILAGITTASIVTGNTVILKPSELTSVIAHQFFKLMKEVGLPDGVINLVTGYGSEIGDYLVDHPQTRFINFTGSKEVGKRIYERAGKTQTGQLWLKRVVAEMGGKDGIVVDETANLERAAQAIVDSAFGFQGQKCSAGSRAIVVHSVYDKVLELVVEKTKKLKVGSPIENFEMGPVSDEKAFHKIMNYIEMGKKEGTLVCGGEKAEGNGYYIQPTIFSDVDRRARIFQEEIFGPVLTFTKANDYREAIDLYNDTEYGLTGAFHSTNSERIQESLQTMYCGNLYINKKCTGALVGVHPFGGFNMSGTDSKAGGPDYLLQFVQPKMTTILVD